jgi:hypothetical protein
LKLDIVRRLASEHGIAKLDEAIAAYERDRTNLLGAEGADEGETLSHLLTARFVRERMSQGMDMNAALREYAQRVKSFVSPKRKA